jgi:hypothetical protein
LSSPLSLVITPFLLLLNFYAWILSLLSATPKSPNNDTLEERKRTQPFLKAQPRSGRPFSLTPPLHTIKNTNCKQDFLTVADCCTSGWSSNLPALSFLLACVCWRSPVLFSHYVLSLGFFFFFIDPSTSFLLFIITASRLPPLTTIKRTTTRDVPCCTHFTRR